MPLPLILEIDLEAPEPVYRQIVNGLRAKLVNRALTAGDRLPTVRQLAQDLGIHHNTVAEAYRLLAQEGWLDLVRGRGAEVRERSQPRRDPEVERGFQRRLAELVAHALGAGVERDLIARELAQLAGEVSAETGRGQPGG